MQDKTNSQYLIKKSHINQVFNLIHQKSGISRADIKKITKLSAPTISSLVDELILKGLCIETGVKNASTSGRKGISLCVNSMGGYFAVVTVSKNHFRLRLYDLSFGEIFSKKERYDSRELLSESLSAFLKDNILIENYGSLLGICVALPAIVDKDNKIVSSTVLKLRPKDDVFLKLTRLFPTAKIMFANNSSLIAYAEMEFGNHEASSLVCVDINDGVGAASVIEGKLLIGSQGMACEFGHVSVDMFGPKCRCGSRGCMETLVSVPAILKKAKEIVKKEIASTDLAEYVAKNKELSLYIDYVSEVLAFGINNMANLFDPDVVVISGDILSLGERFIKSIEKNLEKIILSPRNIQIKASSMGDKSEFKGGVKYIFDSLFR